MRGSVCNSYDGHDRRDIPGQSGASVPCKHQQENGDERHEDTR